MEPTETTTAATTYRDVIKPFEFSGSTKEYYGIWIVNILLTILTLGIYSAWAKVRNKQYFYGNTTLDGHAFRYTANPVQILKGRLIAVALFAIYYFSGLLSPIAAAVTIVLLMLAVPAFVVMSMSFQLRNSAYKNIRFNFDKDFRQSYMIFSLPVLVIGLYIAIMTLISPSAGNELNPEPPDPALGAVGGALGLLIFLLFPWWEYLLTRFKVTRADFGTADFGFAASTWDYYKMYLLPISMIILLLVIIAIAIPAYNGYLEQAGESAEMPRAAGIIIVFALILFYFWLFAYIATRRTNLVYNNLSVDGHKTRSDLRVGYMLYLYLTNTLVLALTLGLMTPWARIRTARYRASRTHIQPAGDFDSFIGAQSEHQSAFGEEMGEVFDYDLGM